jgi:hypothetical protein
VRWGCSVKDVLADAPEMDRSSAPRSSLAVGSEADG